MIDLFKEDAMHGVALDGNENTCMNTHPVLHFWMMGQILVVYGSLILAVCYIFRKYCQDPDLEKEEAEMALKKKE
jgi:hypothetical protein